MNKTTIVNLSILFIISFLVFFYILYTSLDYNKKSSYRAKIFFTSLIFSSIFTFIIYLFSNQYQKSNNKGLKTELCDKLHKHCLENS